MNKNSSNPKVKEFSFKGATFSTVSKTFLAQSQRESKENRSNSCQNLKNPERSIESRSITASADVSSFVQSNISLSSEEGHTGPYPRNLGHFKSDNESNNTKKTHKASKTQKTSLRWGSEIQDNNTLLGQNLIYKTDPELQEPRKSIRTPFLAEFPKEESFLLRVFSMSGDLVGVWIYLAPLAFYYGGFVSGCFVFLVVSLMVYYSEMLLVSCAVLSKKSTIWEVSEVAYGSAVGCFIRIWVTFYHWWEITISLMFLNQMLAFFVRLLLEVESVEGSAEAWLNPEGKVWTPCLYVCVILPISFFKKKLWLAGNSFKMGFIVAIYILILVIYHSFANSISQQFQSIKSFDSSGFLNLFPMATYSICKGDRILLYYQRMKNQNMKRIGKELKTSRTLNSGLILALSIFGYATWGVEPFDLETYQFLNMAPYPKNPEWVLAHICLIVVVLLTVCEMARVFEMYLWIKSRCLLKLVSIVLMLFAVAFSMFLFEISKVMIWIGCLVCSPVSLFFPLICYVRLKKKRNILKKTLMKLGIIGLMTLVNIVVLLAYVVRLFIE